MLLPQSSRATQGHRTPTTPLFNKPPGAQSRPSPPPVSLQHPSIPTQQQQTTSSSMARKQVIQPCGVPDARTLLLCRSVLESMVVTPKVSPPPRLPSSSGRFSFFFSGD